MNMALKIFFLFVATIGISGCFKNSECETLMAKLFSTHSSEFTSGGCIDNTHAYLYHSDWPDVLMFVSASKDIFIVDSVIDFNHSFDKYANLEELYQAIISETYSYYSNGSSKEKYTISEAHSYDKSAKEREREIYKKIMEQSIRRRTAEICEETYEYEPYPYYENNEEKHGLARNSERSNFFFKYREAAKFPKLHNPVIYRKKNDYQLVSDEGIYEISFQNKEIVKILEFKIKTPTIEVKICKNTFFVKEPRRGWMVYFSPKYTKITFAGNFSEESSYFILHENRELTINVNPWYCLSVNMKADQTREFTYDDEVKSFGDDCTPKTKIITEVDCTHIPPPVITLVRYWCPIPIRCL
ncbi:MAG: hypothetical protein LBC85_09845 [Fibromonadaceae bacterium]|jgi:hypothetical protein|nr:hypothetical protein [Fibromonadaceae bacterium]